MLKKLFGGGRPTEAAYGRLTFACIAAYALFMLYACIQTQAMVPDEKGFLSYINAIDYGSAIDVLRTPNYLGYGAIYWIVMKFLRYFPSMRLFSFLLLASVPVCIALTNRRLGVGGRGIFFATVLYLSCPMSWFTGKIIGPEIMGMAIGAWGGYLAFSAIGAWEDGEKYGYPRLLLAGAVLGISAGVKLNYVAMFAFVALYLFLRGWLVPICGKSLPFREGTIRAMKAMSILGAGFLAGMVVANPVMVMDFGTFRAGYGEVSSYSLKYLRDVLWREYIEWDLVNSGGMDNAIMSVAAFAVLVICSLLFHRDKPLAASAAASSLLLFLLCSKGRFLGWYLLPIIYFACLIIPDVKIVPVLLAANLVWMWPNTAYQVTSKVQQVERIARMDEVERIVDKWKPAYPSYSVYYFIDVCVDAYPMFPTYLWGNETSPNRLLFISERARANEVISSFYEDGARGENGYHFLEEEDGIAVIVYEAGT